MVSIEVYRDVFGTEGTVGKRLHHDLKSATASFGWEVAHAVQRSQVQDPISKPQSLTHNINVKWQAAENWRWTKKDLGIVIHRSMSVTRQRQ